MQVVVCDIVDATRLGRLGVWAHEDKLDSALAVALEQLGYGAIWIGGSPGGDLAIARELLESTERIVVATGIVNVWSDPAADIAAVHRSLVADFGDRFLLGIGIGHPEATSDYRHPYQALVDYLDELDANGVDADSRVLAALGPRVLRLARDRTAGAHPYLVTPDYTRQARAIVGPGVFLAPEQRVVLADDPAQGRAIGRPSVETPYLGLSNYLANLRRLGFDDADFADGGSDRLIDALVAHGDGPRIAARLREHLDAGADHVAVQVIADGDPLPTYRAVAASFA